MPCIRDYIQRIGNFYKKPKCPYDSPLKTSVITAMPGSGWGPKESSILFLKRLDLWSQFLKLLLQSLIYFVFQKKCIYRKKINSRESLSHGSGEFP